MKQYWKEVRTLLGLLVYVVKGKDPDGCDLYFLSSSISHKIKKATDAEDIVWSRSADYITSLDLRLGEALSSRLQKWENGGSGRGLFGFGKVELRHRIVYVLTDGVLAKGNPNQGHGAIRGLYERAKATHMPRGHIGIQFISFGNDPVGLQRLQALNRLGSDGINFVDVEPSDGNFLKMLLGSIDDSFALDDGDRSDDYQSAIGGRVPHNAQAQEPIVDTPHDSVTDPISRSPVPYDTLPAGKKRRKESPGLPISTRQPFSTGSAYGDQVDYDAAKHAVIEQEEEQQRWKPAEQLPEISRRSSMDTSKSVHTVETISDDAENGKLLYESLAETGIQDHLSALEEHDSDEHLPKVQLASGYRMINAHWKCPCGHVGEDKYYGFSPGAVVRAMQHRGNECIVQYNPGGHQSSMLLSNIHLAVSDRLSDVASLLLQFVRRPRKDDQEEDDDRSHNSPGDDGGDGEVEMQATAREQEKWVFVCITKANQRRTTSMIPLGTADQNDHQLFDKLRDEYRAAAGLWRRLFGLVRISCIRLVKFRKTILPRYFVYKNSEDHPTVEVLPPSRQSATPDIEWYYSPDPPDFVPPVGSDELLHCYLDKNVCGKHSFYKDRFPKHVRGLPEIPRGKDEVVSWGIELKESRDLYFLWIVGFAIMFSSLAFGVAWAIVRNDVSGGFTVASYLIGCAACLVGSVQFALDQV